MQIRLAQRVIELTQIAGAAEHAKEAKGRAPLRHDHLSFAQDPQEPRLSVGSMQPKQGHTKAGACERRGMRKGGPLFASRPLI
ncbi:hypothetical protein ACVDG8_016250 [Mesorhizobium sp. ORM8.1]